ncbi:extracellular solute-binding protein [Micromonospora pattaloongensis]|nr:extracellular solute-binding protein [Micromonospora pattaloongensis]
MTTPISRRSLLGLAGATAGAALLGACGDDKGTDSGGNATIEWWHISNTDPMLGIWQQAANDFMAKNPGVTIKITPLANEAFKSKLTTVTQSGNAPSLFSSWGGGVLAQQVDAGLLKDISADISSWVGNLAPVSLKYYQVDGKYYGLPFDSGMVGFWYNKDLFAKANITNPPATWTEFLDAVRNLKAAGVTPIALGGKDKWPTHFYWSYLALRIGGAESLEAAMRDKNFETPDLLTATQKLKELFDLQPFQKGFLAATYDKPDGQAALVGNGKAAMELMGQFAPSNQAAFSQSKSGLGDKLGFFPFPSVEGGKGKVSDIFGGGNGFAVGKDAPPKTVEFLKYLLDVEVQRKGAASGAILPVTKGAEDAIKDPNQQVVAKTVNESTAFQLYLDQAWEPKVGQQVNDSVTELLAGKATPDRVLKSINNAAKR